MVYLATDFTSPFPILRHPRVKVLKFGEQRKLLISPGLLSDAPAQSSLLKSEPADTPKGSSGKSGKLDRASCPGCTPIFCLSVFSQSLPHPLQKPLQSRKMRQSLEHPMFQERKLPQGCMDTQQRASHRGICPHRTPAGRRRSWCWGWAT